MCALCDHTAWGGGGGKKRRTSPWAARCSRGPVRHFRALLPSTHALKGQTVSSRVEKRHDQRVWEEVLAHAATQTDSAAVLGRLHTAVEERGVALKGSTTAGAALSPEPMR